MPVRVYDKQLRRNITVAIPDPRVHEVLEGERATNARGTYLPASLPEPEKPAPPERKASATADDNDGRHQGGIK